MAAWLLGNQMKKRANSVDILQNIPRPHLSLSDCPQLRELFSKAQLTAQISATVQTPEREELDRSLVA